MAAEARDQFDRLPLWGPVGFGVGAALYLGQMREPDLWPTVMVCGVVLALCVGVIVISRGRLAIVLATAMAMVAAGFLVAKVHSDSVAAPITPTGLGATTVDGWVVDVASPSDSGERVLIAPVRVAGLSTVNTPVRVRIVLKGAGGPQSVPPPGSPVHLVTLLDPPPGPASPGAYDFARDAWFESIGGVGLALRAPTPSVLASPPWPLRLEMTINAMRWSTARRLAAAIGKVMGPQDGGAAGLAVAVTTSHEDWLASVHRDDLRASGLAHMLAIAGLHTAAVSGFAFFAVRLAIASWPWLALRVSGKKAAALIALFVVCSYLLLSGAHPPARRAAITASVAFLAILVDRRAFSLHSLMVAALVIMVMEPEVVLSPGFEMSFCATASLIALAELWPRHTTAAELPFGLRHIQRAKDWLFAMMAVSLVAGLATGPFAIQHFNRIANYGVLANLSADFLASAVLMPALAVGLLLQIMGVADGLASPVFWLAGWSARSVIELAHLFASAPWAVLSAPSAPQLALAISYLGIILACLWRGRLRWLGLPMAAAVMVWPHPQAPVAWIAADGNDAAIVVAGREVVMKPGSRAYATQLWAQRRGLTMSADFADASRRQQRVFDCDRKGCSSIASFKPALSAWWGRRPPSKARLDRLCAGAEILILRAELAIPPGCAAGIVLNKDSFSRGGSAEVYAAPGRWRIVWAQSLRGRRPWTLSDSAG